MTSELFAVFFGAENLDVITRGLALTYRDLDIDVLIVSAR